MTVDTTALTAPEAQRLTERILNLRSGLVSRIASDPAAVFPKIRRREPKSPTGHIYFIQSQGNWAIKIGFALDVERRVRTLQTGSPERLEVVGIMPGTVRAEKALHREFCADRIRGEWFQPSEGLINYIEERAR